MVTHSTTDLPIGVFSTADQTGCAAFRLLWPYALTKDQGSTLMAVLRPRRLSPEEDVDFENGSMISARASLCRTWIAHHAPPRVADQLSGLSPDSLLATDRRSRRICRQEVQKHTAAGIRWWSPTQPLIRR